MVEIAEMRGAKRNKLIEFLFMQLEVFEAGPPDDSS